MDTTPRFLCWCDGNGHLEQWWSFRCRRRNQFCVAWLSADSAWEPYLPQNNQPVFSLSGFKLACGYISAIAGNDLAGNIDPGDPCSVFLRHAGSMASTSFNLLFLETQPFVTAAVQKLTSPQLMSRFMTLDNDGSWPANGPQNDPLPITISVSLGLPPPPIHWFGGESGIPVVRQHCLLPQLQ